MNSVVKIDLLTRFLFNLPPGELEDMNRVLFHMEMGHWFYLDMKLGPPLTFPHFVGNLMRLPNNTSMSSSFSTGATALKALSSAKPHEIDTFVHSYIYNYKYRIPVFGTATFRFSENKWYLLLIRSHDCNKWGFPKGKQNYGEDGKITAIRETMEETGFQPDETLLTKECWVLKQITIFPIQFPFEKAEAVPLKPGCQWEVAEVKWIEISKKENHCRFTYLVKEMWPQILKFIETKSHKPPETQSPEKIPISPIGC